MEFREQLPTTGGGAQQHRNLPSNVSSLHEGSDWQGHRRKKSRLKGFGDGLGVRERISEQHIFPAW